MNIKLEDLGLSREEIQSRVVEKLAEQLLYDPEGDQSAMATAIEKEYKQRIADGVKQVAENAVTPKIQEILDKTTFQETSRWGEPTAPVMTLKDFIIARAEAWMTEKVDFNGKSQKEDSYNWHGTQTRVAHMIHQHLHYHIEGSVKKALADVNSKLAKGIEETVKMKLEECLKSLSVTANISK